MTPEEIARLSPEERARLAAAEQEALVLLARQMRETRRVPRRHMRLAFLVLVGGAALVMLLVVVLQLA